MYVIVPLVALVIAVALVRWWRRAMQTAPSLTEAEQQTARGYAMWQAMAAAGPGLALIPFLVILLLACAIGWGGIAFNWAVHLLERLQVS